MHDDIAIRVENLSKKYILRHSQTNEIGTIVNEYWALKNVSFEIRKGESVGIIGHNGSGKSTLLKILAGITKPTSGSIQINGRVASILDIGAGFHPELSGRENVFLSGQVQGFSNTEIQQKFDAIVAFSGIERFIDEPVKNYSNGMYLRLAFSIITHLDFDVYLFDEVLGVGDAEFQEKSFEKIRQLATEARKTFLMVSHNIMAMSKLSSRMLFLEKGIVSVYSDKKEIINDYLLSQTTATNPSPVFIKHINLLVSDENGDEKKSYENGEKIIVKIASDFYSIPDDLLIAFRITDIYGNTVFNSSPYLDKIHFQLKNLFRIEIPEYFFNEGFFNVDIVFHNSEKILFEVKRLSKFKVYLNESMKRHKLYGESGVVKPYFKWENVIE